MKKICIIAGYAPSILNFRKELVERLLDQYMVHIIVPQYDSKIIQAIEALGASVVQLPMQRNGLNPFSDYSYYRTLQSALNTIQPDAVFSYTIKPVIWAGLAAKRAGVRSSYSLITGLGFSFTELDSIKKKLVHFIVCRLYKRALAKASHVFFQNPDDANVFFNKKLVPANKVSVINGSGVNLDFYSYPNALPKKTTFLMIARLLKDKGVMEYLHAARLIKQKYADTVEFKLVGWFDDNPSCVSEDEVDGFVKAGVVDFLGRLDDVRDIIAKSSVYVLPSYSEGTPRTVLEAMSMGKAVITTDARGCKETVVDGYNGFLVPVKSVDNLVEAMEKFIKEPSLVFEMGRNGRKLAEEKYDVHKVNQAILDIIKN